MRNRARETTLALMALTLAACAGEGPSGNGESSAFDQIQSEIFDQSCVAGACHSASTQAGNLSLAAGESYDQLVDIEPDNAVAREADLLRVEPNSVEGSFLVAKLTGDLGQGEGARMPLGAPPLPQDQIDQIISWIEDGAPQ